MSIIHLVLLVALLVLIIFSFVLFFGAPFLPTQNKFADDAIDLLGLKAGQTMLELGSGDGRILLAAARRGIKSIGFELNPLLVIYSRMRTWRYRHLVQVRLANYWHRKLPTCDGIYVFLLDPYMAKLDRKIQAEAKKPVKLVSFAFAIPGKKPAKTKIGMRLYTYN